MRKDEGGKPPYRVPSMADINAMEKNGYRVVSTFSGGGGSSTGYKMAGFDVLLASEFVESARETYRLNHPGTIIDPRDIREVQPDEILERTGLEPGELDILDGSPPCASFSTAGAREKGWGRVKKYSDRKQRSDDLFFEYARLLRGIKPKTFVAENVSGLIKGTAKGYFKAILAELRKCGYEVKAALLDAQWLGVPQTRQRLIFVGVRHDLCDKYGVEPAFPKPLPYRYTLSDAIDLHGGIGKVEPEASIERYAIGQEWKKLNQGEQSKKYFQLVRCRQDKPVGTVTATGGAASAASISHPFECRKFSIAELKRICSFPDDYRLAGTYAQQYERLGRSVPPVMMMHIAKTIKEAILDRCVAKT